MAAGGRARAQGFCAYAGDALVALVQGNGQGPAPSHFVEIDEDDLNGPKWGSTSHVSDVFCRSFLRPTLLIEPTKRLQFVGIQFIEHGPGALGQVGAWSSLRVARNCQGRKIGLGVYRPAGPKRLGRGRPVYPGWEIRRTTDRRTHQAA